MRSSSCKCSAGTRPKQDRVFIWYIQFDEIYLAKKLSVTRRALFSQSRRDGRSDVEDVHDLRTNQAHVIVLTQLYKTCIGHYSVLRTFLANTVSQDYYAGSVSLNEFNFMRICFMIDK